jgi:hypothetical protein
MYKSEARPVYRTLCTNQKHDRFIRYYEQIRSMAVNSVLHCIQTTNQNNIFDYSILCNTTKAAVLIHSSHWSHFFGSVFDYPDYCRPRMHHNFDTHVWSYWSEYLLDVGPIRLNLPLPDSREKYYRFKFIFRNNTSQWHVNDRCFPTCMPNLYKIQNINLSFITSQYGVLLELGYSWH